MVYICAVHMLGGQPVSSKLLGQLAHSWSQFAFTLYFVEQIQLFKLRIRLLACGGTASISITEGEDETNNEQDLPQLLG